MAEGPTAAEAGADDLARRCAAAMWESDLASRDLGMVLEEVRAGSARLSMRVGEHMVNGHELCHGGYIATLADSAFAFACNSYDDVTVASGFDITFLTSARLGDELVASARERVRRGRSGLYDITVTRRDGAEEVVAEMRGRSRSLGRPILDR
ncbi:MAG: hydroxyphenylacetyl-CoA thioesterase PaaI [Nocardioidaceae bacterium]